MGEMNTLMLFVKNSASISAIKYLADLSGYTGRKEIKMKSYESRGYDIFDFDGTGMLEIEKIDEMHMFDSDEDAVEQAIKDGIKIIPVEELPENFDRKYLGWIDTPKNREAIKRYCEI